MIPMVFEASRVETCMTQQEFCAAAASDTARGLVDINDLAREYGWLIAQGSAPVMMTWGVISDNGCVIRERLNSREQAERVAVALNRDLAARNR